MDLIKRNKLVEELSKQSAPQIIRIERFLDGNDDPGSIGCNLVEHPGIEVFRTTLLDLSRRGDVEAVYAQIAELDPGDGCWPFTDTIFVAGTITAGELREFLKMLQPDEVGPGDHFEVPAYIEEKHKAPVTAAWWD
jgi:hypothetical protein